MRVPQDYAVELLERQRRALVDALSRKRRGPWDSPPAQIEARLASVTRAIGLLEARANKASTSEIA